MTDTAPTARRVPPYLAPLLSGALAIVVLGLILARDVVTDTEKHVTWVLPMLREGKIVGNFLFYVLAGVPALLHPTEQTVVVTAFCVLVGAVAAKGWVLQSALRERLPRKRGATTWPAAALAVGLCVAWSLPTRSLYIGQLPPNVWHNATLMLLFPFAVAAWWEGHAVLQEGREARPWRLLATTLLGIAAKPSFFLAFAPALVVLALLRGRRAPWRAIVITVGAGLVLLVLQYASVYLQPGGHPFIEEPRPRTLTVQPFAALAANSENLPLSLLASFCFPLVYAALYWRRVTSSPLLRYTLLIAGIAFVEGALLRETGRGTDSGNLLWQLLVANLLLFAACCHDWLHAERDHWSWREWSVATVFAAHVAAGLLYIVVGLGVKARAIYV